MSNDTGAGLGLVLAFAALKRAKDAKQAIENLGTVLNLKGTVASTSDLPLTGNKKGDVYIVTADSSEYVWTSDSSSGTLSDYESIGRVYSQVTANPTLAGTEADLTGLEVDGTKYKVPPRVTADPTLSGTESTLTSLSIGSTDYRIETTATDYCITITGCDAISATSVWPGTVEYSNDKAYWTVWDGSRITCSSVGSHKTIYFRGYDNTIVGGHAWTLEPNLSDTVSISGNLDTLLDYKLVQSGQVPHKSAQCFALMFWNSPIVDASKLLIDLSGSESISQVCATMFAASVQLKYSPMIKCGTGLASDSLIQMFQGCTGLITSPDLLVFAGGSASSMFSDCSSLIEAPRIVVSGSAILNSMFYRCANLESLPELVGTGASYVVATNMFYGCAKIKIASAKSSTYSQTCLMPRASYPGALSDMFANTGGTFTGTPTENTAYYTSNAVLHATYAENPNGTLNYYQSTSVIADTIPVANSVNLITSGGVYNALGTKLDISQGVQHANDILAVDAQGNIVPAPLAIQQDITYAELCELQSTGKLVPGMRYRITDYVTKVDGKYNLAGIGGTGYLHYARSAEHPFYIIVTAKSTNSISENAEAAHISGDNYFIDGDGRLSNLSAWKLKYTLANSKWDYSWADEVTGKGVIYWMQDEYGNEAGYDFKNIQFLRYGLSRASGSTTPGDLAYSLTNPVRYGNLYSICVALMNYMNTGSYVNPFESWGYIQPDNSIDQYDFSCGANILGIISASEVDANYLSTYNADWYYTFDITDDSGMHKDATLQGYGSVPVYNNKLTRTADLVYRVLYGSQFIWGLGDNVFEAVPSSGTYYPIVDNVLDKDTYSNTFRHGSVSWHIHDGVVNTAVVANVKYGVIGTNCQWILVGTNDTAGVSVGANSNYIMLYGSNNTIGNDVLHCVVHGRNNMISAGCEYVELRAQTTNVIVLSGTSGSSSVPLQLAGSSSPTYTTYIGKDSNGTVRSWNPADMATYLGGGNY